MLSFSSPPLRLTIIVAASALVIYPSGLIFPSYPDIYGSLVSLWGFCVGFKVSEGDSVSIGSSVGKIVGATVGVGVEFEELLFPFPWLLFFLSVV